MTEQDLKKFELAGSSVNNLLIGDGFEAVKYQAYGFIDNLDFDGALKYAGLLEKKIANYKPQNANEIYYCDILWFWVSRLKLFSFSSLSVNEQGDLLKNNILKILRGELDIKWVLYKFLNYFQSDDIILEYAKSFLSGMSKGQEVLGADSDKFARLNFNPTVENWCKEYISALNTDLRGAKIDPGAFNIVKFLDSNNYVKLLNKEETKVLKDLLDLYNWLLSPLAATQVVKKASIPYTNTQKLQIPKEVLEPLPASLPPKIPPVVPAPKNAPTLKPFAEISNLPKREGNNPSSFIPSTQGGSASGGNPLPKPTLPPFSTVLPKKPVSEPQGVNEPRKYAPANLPEEPVTEEFGRVNFQDILKERKQGEQNSAGLTMSDGQDRKQEFLKIMADKQAAMVKNQGAPSENNPSSFIHNPLPDIQVGQQKVQTPPGPLFRKEGEQDKAVDIDRKLKELEKRTKGNN